MAIKIYKLYVIPLPRGGEGAGVHGLPRVCPRGRASSAPWRRPRLAAGYPPAPPPKTSRWQHQRSGTQGGLLRGQLLSILPIMRAIKNNVR